MNELAIMGYCKENGRFCEEGCGVCSANMTTGPGARIAELERDLRNALDAAGHSVAAVYQRNTELQAELEERRCQPLICALWRPGTDPEPCGDCEPCRKRAWTIGRAREGKMIDFWSKLGKTTPSKDKPKVKLPWPKPNSIYDNDGPAQQESFAVHDIKFIVAPTNTQGVTTGRTRYRVACLTCHDVLHEHTTSPRFYIEGHLNINHSIRIALEHT